MKLLSISIEKLFGQFDYDIVLNQEEGITILTGPNGYGKTSILNIIRNLFKWGWKADDFPCKSAVASFSDGRVLKFPEDMMDMRDMEKTMPIYLINNQRLKKIVWEKNYANSFIEESVEKTKDAISLFSQELKEYIAGIQAKGNAIAKDINTSYAARLFEYNNAMPKTEFERRYGKLTEKYQLLQKYKIYQNDLAKAEYEGENRRALSIYLEDWEKKTAVYDELLAKIALFLSIMESKCLINKTFTINAEQGFCFTGIDGKLLQLTDLSSGEQHETILLYELLFNALPDSLVLIDEPETSMHVAWQIEFIRDLKKITKIKQLSFIVATHSPDIINDNTSIDLYELIHGSAESDDE
ncbi:MAG: AAA family ATPase [Treponema sp.]|jgi:predicted ATP-binding protein involved in virulence|nr:AAA family ATPase [Treponema sp.]